MSSIGVTKGEEDLNFIGIVVLAHGESLKFISNLTIASFACINPNLMPMQLLEKLFVKKTSKNHKFYSPRSISEWYVSEWLNILHIFLIKPLRVKFIWVREVLSIVMQ